jgi:hypothetical protein
MNYQDYLSFSYTLYQYIQQLSIVFNILYLLCNQIEWYAQIKITEMNPSHRAFKKVKKFL